MAEITKFFLCCWHVIRKAIWRNLEVRNLEILRNVCLFSSSCLCPLGCLIFFYVEKKIKFKYYVPNISRFLTLRFHQIAFHMTCHQYWVTIISSFILKQNGSWDCTKSMNKNKWRHWEVISFQNSKSLQLGDNLKSCQCIAADLKKEKSANHADNS